MIHHRTLAKMSAEAYDHASFSVHECEASIKFTDDLQIVAFRGTEAGSLVKGAGWFDVLRDARVLPWYDKDAGFAHAGFLKGGQRAAEFLAGILPHDRPVILTGHSLGGAVALVCAVKLHAKGFNVAEWVGFASPKVQLSSKQYPFKQTNYRHGADIVPLLPSLPFYRHNCPLVRVLPSDGLPNWLDHNVDYYTRYV